MNQPVMSHAIEKVLTESIRAKGLWVTPMRSQKLDNKYAQYTARCPREGDGPF